MDLDATTAAVISRARQDYSTSPETGGGTDAFDHMIGIEGIARYGELFQATYEIANEGYAQVQMGAGEAALEARKERADALWEQLQPGLERYAEECRTARYTGWSRESSGPLRRTR